MNVQYSCIDLKGERKEMNTNEYVHEWHMCLCI